MKHTRGSGGPVVAAPAAGQQARLVVVDRGHLHPLGRFFQAMLLNFLKIPGKVRVVERLNLTVAFDHKAGPGSNLTITFARGRVTLECGIRSEPDITIRGETPVLMKLSRLPYGREMVGYLKTPEGKDLLARWRSGDLNIKGIVRHPLAMMSFMKFMAPNVI